MNAFEQIPITSIRPSTTAIQNMRRSHFNVDKICELADSIRTQGLLQPILVRQVKPEGITSYEIVAGERRWLAADRAGLAHIDCNVRELNDSQVLEAQLVENLQREDVHPLEEAEGYRELIRMKNLRPEELGQLIGKSRAYVYARLKLLDLCPAGRALLDSGDLDASKALVIARFVPKLQEKILKDYRCGTDSRTSFREFVARTRSQFMVDLTSAPFTRDDDRYHTLEKQEGTRLKQKIPLPACNDCPSYSRNDGELQAAFDADAHVCTDKSCYDVKVVQFFERQRKAAEDAGKAVLTGAAAKAAIPSGFYSGCNSEFVNLDEECDDVAFPEPEPVQGKDESDEAFDVRMQAWDTRSMDWKKPTFRELLEDEFADRTVLAEGDKGKLVELVPVKDAAKLLKTKGIKLFVPQAQRELPGTESVDRKEEMARQEERQQRETDYRMQVLRAVHTNWKGPLKRDDLLLIMKEMLDNGGHPDELDLLYPDFDAVKKLNEHGIARFIMMLCVASCVEGYGGPAPLLALAKRHKVDPAKIKKEIAAGERAAKKAAAKPAPAPASKSSKPAKKKASKK